MKFWIPTALAVLLLAALLHGQTNPRPDLAPVVPGRYQIAVGPLKSDNASYDVWMVDTMTGDTWYVPHPGDGWTKGSNPPKR